MMLRSASAPANPIVNPTSTSTRPSRSTSVRILPRVAAERHADPNLARALARPDTPGRHRGPARRGRARCRQIPAPAPLACGAGSSDLSTRSGIEKTSNSCSSGSTLARARLDRRERGARIARGANREADAARRLLRVRDVVGARPRVLAFDQALQLHRADDADHLHPLDRRARLRDVFRLVRAGTCDDQSDRHSARTSLPAARRR